MTLPNDRQNDARTDSPDDVRPDAAPGADEERGEDTTQEPASTDAQEPDRVATLEQQLAAAEASAAEHKDLYMRVLAELENVRKRAAREVEQAHKFALERFAGELIGVKDSLELGLASAARSDLTDARPLVEGTEATLKLLARAFENAGIVEIDPQGQPFDPQLHEAMATQPSAEHQPDSVVQVIQKGYQLNGRLLRPARVIVAKEPA